MDILDPHDPSLADAPAKAHGLAMFAKAHAFIKAWHAAIDPVERTIVRRAAWAPSGRATMTGYLLIPAPVAHASPDYVEIPASVVLPAVKELARASVAK